MKKILNNIEEYFIALSLCVMVLINFGNVLSRYFIHASWSFTEELLIILFVWNTMLATAIAFKYKAHLGLSALTDLFPKKYQKYITLFGAVLTIVLMIILARFGVGMIANQMKYNIRTAAMDIPEWVASISIVIGALLIIFRVITSTISTLGQDTKANLDKRGE
ncbi:MAG: TRAP transporter small permease [Sedimentibacter sp.]